MTSHVRPFSSVINFFSVFVVDVVVAESGADEKSLSFDVQRSMSDVSDDVLGIDHRFFRR